MSGRASYPVHVLTGDSLTAAEVTINGLAIDVSTVEAIDRSVQDIVERADALARSRRQQGVDRGSRGTFEGRLSLGESGSRPITAPSPAA